MFQANLSFRPLTGIYEPSAIQQLPDGRFLVVEDEKDYPFSLVWFDENGQVDSSPLNAETADFGAGLGKLDDLEALALDQAGQVYAITSHSRNDQGEEKRSRDKLVRFRVEGDRLIEPRLCAGIKPALCAAHPVLAAAATILDVKAAGGLNIEALEMTPDQQRLLIGFRSPLLDGRALIVGIDNPGQLFETGAPPQVAPSLISLDLGGYGLRGMAWLEDLGGYLLISGPVAREQVQFQLWLWTGDPGQAPRRLSVPGLAGFEHAEGVCPAFIHGRRRVILVSDDGDRDVGRYANYLLLDPSELHAVAGT